MNSPIKFGWRVPAFPVDDSRRGKFIQQIRHNLDVIQETYASAWVADHLIPWANFQSDDTDTLECLTTISYLAAAYPKLDFGSSVLCQSYRNPALHAKMAATLQILSGGRFIYGIGAGWKEDEYISHDYEFPKASVRIKQMEETIIIARKMWHESPASFEGKYYKIKAAYCEPRPDPAPPILVGGGGEKLILRVVAKYADWWNLPSVSVETYAHKLNVLRAHCEAVGRDVEEIVKTLDLCVALAETEAEAKGIDQGSPFGGIVGTPDQVAEALRRFVEIGVTYFMVRFADFPNTAGAAIFAEKVMPQFR